jgi:hypothetical protein
MPPHRMPLHQAARKAVEATNNSNHNTSALMLLA